MARFKHPFSGIGWSPGQYVADQIMDVGGELVAGVPQVVEVDALAVTQRVSVREAIMIGGQKIQVGLSHARKIVQVDRQPAVPREPLTVRATGRRL